MYRLIIFVFLFTLSYQSYAQNIDPTKPLSASSTSGIEEVKKGLILETIIHSSEKKSAIISGKLIKVGDYIGGHELIVVNSSNVILRSDGERLKLSIFSSVVTK